MNRKQMKKRLLRLLANNVFNDLFDIEIEGNFDGKVTDARLARWESVQQEIQDELDRRSR